MAAIATSDETNFVVHLLYFSGDGSKSFERHLESHVA